MPHPGSSGVVSEVMPFREVMDGDPDRGIALFDLDLNLVYANPVARSQLYDGDGVILAELRDAIGAFRERLERSEYAPPPGEILLGLDPARRCRATVAHLARPSGRWFVVRVSPPGLFAEPTIRRLQMRFRLTLREAQVALSVARGHSNAEAAVKLGITEKTVKNALMSVYAKCGVRNRVELALKAHDAPLPSGHPSGGTFETDLEDGRD